MWLISSSSHIGEMSVMSNRNGGNDRSDSTLVASKRCGLIQARGDAIFLLSPFSPLLLLLVL